MSPDFEYFIYLKTDRTISHHLSGIALMCVPSGLLILWLFERVVKQPLILLLPRPLCDRLWPYAEPLLFLPVGQFVAIVTSLAIGAFSHIAWDSATHRNGWVVSQIPTLMTPLSRDIRLYNVLQHASTLLGLALLTVWSWERLRHQKPVTEVKPLPITVSERALGRSFLLLTPVLCGLAVIWHVQNPTLHESHRLIIRFVLASLTALFVATLIYSAALRVAKGRGTFNSL
jgi:hypothetical protein